MDDSNSFMTVFTWETNDLRGLTYYEYSDGLGTGKLTTKWVAGNEVKRKTVDAKLGDIEQGKDFLAFKINGTKYIYKRTNSD